LHQSAPSISDWNSQAFVDLRATIASAARDGLRHAALAHTRGSLELLQNRDCQGAAIQRQKPVTAP